MRSTWLLVIVGTGCLAPAPPPESCGEGSLSLTWTIGGAPASESTCQGSKIDHLTLLVAAPDCGTSAVSPIPCALDRFLYKQLPLGPATVELDAVDTAGRAVYSATAKVTLADDAGAPVPLHLQ